VVAVDEEPEVVLVTRAQSVDELGILHDVAA
jgi:hypothetical protein